MDKKETVIWPSGHLGGIGGGTRIDDMVESKDIVGDTGGSVPIGDTVPVKPPVVFAEIMPSESNCIDLMFGALASQSPVIHQVNSHDEFLDTDTERTAREYKTRYIEVRPARSDAEVKKYVNKRKHHDKARRSLPPGVTPETLKPEYARFVPLTREDRTRNQSTDTKRKPRKRWYSRREGASVHCLNVLCYLFLIGLY